MTTKDKIRVRLAESKDEINSSARALKQGKTPLNEQYLQGYMDGLDHADKIVQDVEESE